MHSFSCTFFTQPLVSLLRRATVTTVGLSIPSALQCSRHSPLCPPVSIKLRLQVRRRSDVFCTPSSSPFLGSLTHSGVPVSLPFPTGPPPSNYGYPPPFPPIIHYPQSTDEEVPVSRFQRSREPSVPPSTPSPPRYTSRFFPILNQGSPPVPRLRPASWGSPSRAEEEFDDRQLTRSRSSAEFGGHFGGDEEDLPFGTRTLPPPPTHYDPRRLAAYTTSNASSSSREGSTDSWDVSTTDSLSAAPSLLNYPHEEYGQGHGSFVHTNAGDVTRRSSDQPEARYILHRDRMNAY